MRRDGKKETLRDMYMDTNRSWSYRMPSNKLHGVNTWSNYLNSIIDNYKIFSEFILCWSELWMAKTQLQNAIGKNHVSNSDVQLFLNFRCIGFCSTGLNYFPSQKELCSSFCSCKKKRHALHFVVVHPMRSALYLPKPSAQLLPLIWTLIFFRFQNQLNFLL